jgi:hypothetical protein
MLRFVEGEAAMLLKTRGETSLLIPDLHLGFERLLVSRGITLPSQTKKLLEKIQGLIRSQNPDKLIFMGDVKHETGGISSNEWVEIPKFFETLLNSVSEIELIPGNHDGGILPLLPKRIIVRDSRGVTLKDGVKTITLTHGHTWPRVEALASDTLIMAHNHFTIEFRDKFNVRFSFKVWMIANWRKERLCNAFLKSQRLRSTGGAIEQIRRHFGVVVGSPEIIVMPAMNPLLSGLPVNSKRSGESYPGPLFRQKIIDIPNAQIYLLDGTFVGKVSHIVS